MRKSNFFVLVFGDGKEISGILVAKVLLLFRKVVRGIIESQQYAFLLYMKMSGPMETVDKSLGCIIFLRVVIMKWPTF